MDDRTLSEVLVQLAGVSDANLRSALKHAGLGIKDEKYEIAFSSFAAAGAILLANPDQLGFPPQTPPLVRARLQRRASLVLQLYAALVFMRSEHVEQGLQGVADGSPLAPFRDAFRIGCKQKGQDTVAQHIRNSLCHGTFEFDRAEPKLHFTDRDRRFEIPMEQVDKLCWQVFRLYRLAYEIERPDLQLADKPN